MKNFNRREEMALTLYAAALSNANVDMTEPGNRKEFAKTIVQMADSLLEELDGTEK